MSQAPRRRRAAVLALRLGLTAAVLAFLVRYVDLGALGRVLVQADLWLLAPVAVLRPLLYLVRGFRVWQILRFGVPAKLPLPGVVGWHFVSLNVGVFTPGGLGDFSLAYFLRRYEIGLGEGFAAVVLDRGVNLCVLAAVAMTGATLYFGVGLFEWLVCGLALGLLPVVALVARRTAPAFRRWAGEWGEQVAAAWRVGTRFVFRHPGAVAVNVAGAVVQTLLFTLQTWLCFRMVGSPVPFADALWLSGIGRLVNLLPVTISGLGIYEGSMVYLFGRVGVAAESALAATLVPRAITWTLAAAIVCALVWRRRGGGTSVGSVLASGRRSEP